MAFTGEKLMQGIDSYVSKAISRLSYNTTELCTVSKVNDDGSYQVTNGTVSFKAWGGNEKYAQNDSVYVLVPNGTHDAECMILRKKTTDQDIKVQRESPKDNIAIIGDNLIDLGESDSSGKITIEKRGLREDDFTRHRLDRLYIKFKSYAETGRNAASPSSVLSQGSYTIQFKIEIEGGQTIVFDIPSEDLEGNLFASEEAATYQEECWGINYDRIFQAMLFENPDLYQDVATGEIKVRSNNVPNGEVPAINLIPTGFSYDVVYGSGIDVYGNAVSNINSGSTAITINVELEEIYFGIDPNSFEGTQIDIWWTNEEGEIRWEKDDQVYIADKESYGAKDWTEDSNGNLAKWYAQACIYYKDPETGAVTRIGNEQEILDFQKEVQLKWYINDSTMYKVTDDPTSEAGWLLLENERELSEDIAEAIESDENLSVDQKAKSLEASKKLQNTLKFAFTPRKNLVYYLRTLQLRAAVYIDKIAQKEYSNVLNVNNDDYDLHNTINQSDGFNIQANDNYNGKFFIYDAQGKANDSIDTNKIRSLSLFYNFSPLEQWILENLKVENQLIINWHGEMNSLLKSNDFNKKVIITKNEEGLNFSDNNDLNFYYTLSEKFNGTLQSQTITCQIQLKKDNENLVELAFINYTFYFGQESKYKSGVVFQILPKDNNRAVVIEDNDNHLIIQASIYKDGQDISNKLNEKDIKWEWVHPLNKQDIFLEYVNPYIYNNPDGAFESASSFLQLQRWTNIEPHFHGFNSKGYSELFYIDSSLEDRIIQFSFNKNSSYIDENEDFEIILYYNFNYTNLTANKEWLINYGTQINFNSQNELQFQLETGKSLCGILQFNFKKTNYLINQNYEYYYGTYNDLNNEKSITLSGNEFFDKNFIVDIYNDQQDYPVNTIKNCKIKSNVELGTIYELKGRTEEEITTSFFKNTRIENSNQELIEHFEGQIFTNKSNDPISIPGFGTFLSPGWYEEIDYDCDINVTNMFKSVFKFTVKSETQIISSYFQTQFFKLENQICNYKHFDIFEGTSVRLPEPTQSENTDSVRIYAQYNNVPDFIFNMNYYNSTSLSNFSNGLTMHFTLNASELTDDYQNPAIVPIYYYEDNSKINEIFNNIPTITIDNLIIQNLNYENILSERLIRRKINCSIANIKNSYTYENYYVLKASAIFQGESLESYLPIGYCNIDSLSEFNKYSIIGSTNFYYNINNSIVKDDNKIREISLNYLNENNLNFQMALIPDPQDANNELPLIKAKGGLYVPNFSLYEIKNDQNNIISGKINPPIWYDNTNEISLKFSWDNDNLFWIQPLFQMQNSYVSNWINKWDGSSQIDKDKGIIGSALGIFGSKNNSNSFSGVIIGNVEKLNSSNEVFYESGIYGLKNDLETFHLLNDGSAYIKGELVAESGKIGGLALKNNYLYGLNDKTSGLSTEDANNKFFLVAGSSELVDNNDNIINSRWVKNDDINSQPKFYVTHDGELFSKKGILLEGQIGGVLLKDNYLSSETPLNATRTIKFLKDYFGINNFIDNPDASLDAFLVRNRCDFTGVQINKIGVNNNYQDNISLQAINGLIENTNINYINSFNKEEDLIMFGANYAGKIPPSIMNSRYPEPQTDAWNSYWNKLDINLDDIKENDTLSYNNLLKSSILSEQINNNLPIFKIRKNKFGHLILPQDGLNYRTDYLILDNETYYYPSYSLRFGITKQGTFFGQSFFAKDIYLFKPYTLYDMNQYDLEQDLPLDDNLNMDILMGGSFGHYINVQDWIKDYFNKELLVEYISFELNTQQLFENYVIQNFKIQNNQLKLKDNIVLSSDFFKRIFQKWFNNTMIDISEYDQNTQNIIINFSNIYSVLEQEKLIEEFQELQIPIGVKLHWNSTNNIFEPIQNNE